MRVNLSIYIQNERKIVVLLNQHVRGERQHKTEVLNEGFINFVFTLGDELQILARMEGFFVNYKCNFGTRMNASWMKI